MLTHLSLFTGIGGIDLAAEMAGFKTVGQCEIEDFPTSVLERHFPNANRWRDVRDITEESLRERIGNQQITLITGGFPCQPFSVAGKQKGKNDNRHLWPEMLRVIKLVRPTWVVGENVDGFINMALTETKADLEAAGYQVWPVVLPACGVSAPHQRYRCFIVGYAKHDGLIKAEKQREFDENARAFETGTQDNHKSKGTGGSRGEPDLDMADRDGVQRGGAEGAGVAAGVGEEPYELDSRYGALYEPRFTRKCFVGQPGLGGVPDGVPYWLDETRWPAYPNQKQYGWEPPRSVPSEPGRTNRIKALGNAVVPFQVYPILKTIADIENGIMEEK